MPGPAPIPVPTTERRTHMLNAIGDDLGTVGTFAVAPRVA
jgi:hypothetical protein